MILLMLDFDGTLAPIVRDPARASLGRGMAASLARLAKRNDVVMAVISGRSLADLKQRVRLANIYYAGCHGFEMEGPGWSYLHPRMARVETQVKKLEDRLRTTLAGVQGTIIENKRYALTVHYRRAPRKEHPRIGRLVRQAGDPFRTWLRMEPGRMIHEFRPAVAWGKDKAVAQLMRRHRKDEPYPIFLGDDVTDEPAFEFLKGKGLTIKIDSDERAGRTAAILRLRSQRQVMAFLRSLT
ncbi:MAG: trehalose-phosphatase [Candidatus Edwardsbacteria bacterium]|nr:trehalose-phosphatase [Candidatus Edwardsbacteria bacterium]